ncbi:PIF1 helicase [Striga hermonthica]|uniref:PIF1 helicase n=1 Tax=Striga hermonthica TaxID=68872 RepID=A0A9N7NB42_STRHE|nr:PIF1 helicase [Striga hermonthica]
MSGGTTHEKDARAKWRRLMDSLSAADANSDERDELARFTDWIASIEDGTIEGSNDGCAVIDIAEDILLEPSDDLIAQIVESTYPMLKEAPDDPSYLKDRAILALTLDVVESINEYKTSLNLLDGRMYLSSNSTCKSECNNEFLV